MPHLFLELEGDDDVVEGLRPGSLDDSVALELLEHAQFSAAKLIPWGSNYSFAVALDAPDGSSHLGIYKPRAGEAPLYDFPDGTLFKREVAAYRLSRLLGWRLVPPTTIRQGPHGVGSLQLYIEPAQDPPDWDPRAFWGAKILEIERLVVFDWIANNADRKITHCLRDVAGNIWGIDHGLTFNEVPKLRTVLWQFVGNPVNPSILDDLSALRSDPERLSATFEGLLSKNEIGALEARIDKVLDREEHPVLNPHRNIPYGWW